MRWIRERLTSRFRSRALSSSRSNSLAHARVCKKAGPARTGPAGRLRPAPLHGGDQRAGVSQSDAENERSPIAAAVHTSLAAHPFASSLGPIRGDRRDRPAPNRPHHHAHRRGERRRDQEALAAQLLLHHRAAADASRQALRQLGRSPPNGSSTFPRPMGTGATGSGSRGRQFAAASPRGVPRS